MKIAVFGLGYVGVVSAACLVRDGHDVFGVDPNAVKVDLVNQGNSPIVEPGLEGLLAAGVKDKRLHALADHTAAVQHAEVMFVCVGTPGQANGSLDLKFVRRICEQIGATLAQTSEYKVVVVRSTMLPGSMEAVVIPTLEQFSGKQANRDFGVCINPEFLREGTAIYDYDHPPKTVVGASGERAAKVVMQIYDKLDAPVIVTDLRTAEILKYADNSWHALKVTFANEVARLAKAMDIDSRTVMRYFAMDTKLNISPAYLRPGFAFGGSCLPKDVRALCYQGRLLDVETPVLSSILASNQLHIEQAVSLIREAGSKKVGLLGLSFKEGTDDLRESPIVTLAETLIGKGYELCIFDRNVRLASLVGANKEYILNHIPHISRLLTDEAEAVFRQSDTIVVCTAEKEFREILLRNARDKVVIDLVGALDASQNLETFAMKNYDGIGW